MSKLGKMKTVAYIRVSTDKQSVNMQRAEIERYAVKNKLIIDDFIMLEMSSKKSTKERGIIKLIDNFNSGDKLICSELSRLGRSTQEVLKTIDALNKKGVKTILIKQNIIIDGKNKADMTTKIMVTLFSLFAELERDLISFRTREALASRKRAGVILGRKKGSISKSKYDKDKDKIIQLANMGVSWNKILKIHLDGKGTLKSLLMWKSTRLEETGIGEWRHKTINEK